MFKRGDHGVMLPCLIDVEYLNKLNHNLYRDHFNDERWRYDWANKRHVASRYTPAYSYEWFLRRRKKVKFDASSYSISMIALRTLNRIKLAWGVFTGKYDAVYWVDQ